MTDFGPKIINFEYFEPKWSNSGKTRFSGKIWLCQFCLFSALTSCNKSEKFFEPFSSNMGITLLLGPFWAIRPLKYHISAHFGKTGFFPEKRPCTFLALIVVNFHAEYEENPWSRFWEISVTNQPTTEVILWDLCASAGPKFKKFFFVVFKPVLIFILKWS